MNSPSIKNSYDPQWSISSIWFSLHFQDVKITAKKGRKSSPVFASGVTAEVQRSAEQFCSHHGRGVDSFSDSERKLVSGALVTAMRRAFDVLRALLTGQEPDRAAEMPKQPPEYPPPACSLEKRPFRQADGSKTPDSSAVALSARLPRPAGPAPLRLWHLPTGTRRQGCSNRESRESRGAKKRRFAPNREALNKIPNRPNRYLMTPAVQWELKVVAQTSLLLQRWV